MRKRRATSFGWAIAICACLNGCVSIGSQRLDEDQIAYSQSLTRSEKEETLLNVARLRYGDTPSFLQINQVISGYQLQRSVSGGFNLFPSASSATSLVGNGSIQMQQNPTFTFQPVSGEQFAQSFIRPLSPKELLPLSLSGIPIDVLFRLGVQSVNSFQNSMALTGAGGAGSPGFSLLLRDLRQLQISGLLDVRLQEPAAGTPDKAGSAKSSKVEGRVFLAIARTNDSTLAKISAEAKILLGMNVDAEEIEVVYGRSIPGSGKIALLTRSMLGVLTELGGQVEVPQLDVVQGRTVASVGQIGVESRPTVVIHSGPKAPEVNFVAIEYHGMEFWIDDNDFDSKFAFTVTNILLNLARTTNPPGTIVTIPAS